MNWLGILQALVGLRVGSRRMVVELRGLRRAIEGLVALKALELNVPNPLSLRREVPPAADDRERDARPIDMNPGIYTEIEARRQAWEHGRGAAAPFDQDFLSPSVDEIQADAAERVSTTVWPEDFR